MGRKIGVALVDSEDIGSAEFPQNGKNVKEAKVRMGKGQSKKDKSSKGKIDDRKRKSTGDKWQARKHLKGIAITVGKWRHMKKDCSTLAKTKAKGGRGKSASSLDQLADFVFACLEFNVGHWKWKNYLEDTATLDSCRQHTRQRRENPCETKDFECYRL